MACTPWGRPQCCKFPFDLEMRKIRYFEIYKLLSDIFRNFGKKNGSDTFQNCMYIYIQISVSVPLRLYMSKVYYTIYFKTMLFKFVHVKIVTLGNTADCTETFEIPGPRPAWRGEALVWKHDQSLLGE